MPVQTLAADSGVRIDRAATMLSIYHPAGATQQGKYRVTFVGPSGTEIKEHKDLPATVTHTQPRMVQLDQPTRGRVDRIWNEGTVPITIDIA